MKSFLFGFRGVFFAALILSFWLLLLYLSLISYAQFSAWTILIVLAQTHLSTGLFITAHDAMHGTVANNRSVNNFIGSLCTFLYAFFPFAMLRRKHHLHHSHVGQEEDPDVHQQSYFRWYLSFMLNYVSWRQFLGYAIAFNVLGIWISKELLLVYWIVPAILSTFQLFTFGTFLPHQGEHDNKHQSRSQTKNHLVAFMTCYFFGYHFEHHDSPSVPWWQLYKER